MNQITENLLNEQCKIVKIKKKMILRCSYSLNVLYKQWSEKLRKQQKVEATGLNLTNTSAPVTNE